MLNFILKIFKNNKPKEGKSNEMHFGCQTEYYKRLEPSFYGICGKRWKYYKLYEIRDEGVYFDITKEEYDLNVKLR